MVHFALVKTRLTEESPFHQFFQYILFLERLANIKIERINYQIRYRLLKVFALCLVSEFVLGLIFLVFNEQYLWYIRISVHTIILTAYFFILLYHQFIYRQRPRQMTTTLFQYTASNYYKKPTLDEIVSVLYSIINLENLPHINVHFLTGEIVKHCYQPG